MAGEIQATVFGFDKQKALRTALKRLAAAEAQLEFRKLRGTFKFTVDLDELRKDRK